MGARRATSQRPMFRLLMDGITDPFRHFAVEEALLRGIEEGTSPPTLRLRRVIPSVWIGIFQSPEEDVDVEYCQANGIPIVRRYNPGGAVYQDEGSFCFSLFFRHKELFSHLGIQEAPELYPLVSEAVIATCAHYGLLASRSPTNDCTVGGRKIYGSAQVQWSEGFVHSGTFLVSTDCQVMARVLKPSNLKFADKAFTNVRDRVVTLCEATGMTIPVEEVMWHMSTELAERLALELVPGELLAHELEQADDLYKQKYCRPEWTFPSQPRRSSILSTKAQSGVVTLAVNCEGPVLTAVEVRGDFLIPRQDQLEQLVRSLQGKTLPEAKALVTASPLPQDVRSALLKLFSELEFRELEPSD